MNFQRSSLRGRDYHAEYWCSQRNGASDADEHDRPRQPTRQSPHRRPSARSERRRWIALAVLCLGQLMMVLDATIVNVALPSIQHDLHFTQGNLTWVIDGYLITFGGFLLLAGRLGDLVGRKRVFLTGLVLFTVASMCAGSRQPGDADRRAADPGRRRGRRLERDPRDHRHRVPQARASRPKRWACTRSSRRAAARSGCSPAAR